MVNSREDKEWREFFIEEVVDIYSGKDIYAAERQYGDTPYVSSTAKNNGVGYFVGNSNQTLEKNCLSVNRNGSVGYSFFHPYQALFSNDCRKLKLKSGSKYIGFFIANQITRQRKKYNYGYKMGTGRLKRQKIMLPISQYGQPDFDYMEAYSKSVLDKKTNEYIEYVRDKLKDLKHKDIDSLKDKEWEEFFLNEIFTDIQRGKRLKKSDHKAGIRPYVSSTAMNNGVDRFIGNNDGVRVFKSCLSIANSGSVGASFYHPYEFVASDHVTKLGNKKFNKYILLFMSSITQRLGEKYNFNREINDKRISREKIMLPISKFGQPDYDYMEQYTKNLEHKKITQYLDYICS